MFQWLKKSLQYVKIKLGLGVSMSKAKQERYETILGYYLEKENNFFNDPGIDYTKELKINKLAFLVSIISNIKYNVDFLDNEPYEAWKDGFVIDSFRSYVRNVQKEHLQHSTYDPETLKILKELEPFFGKLSGDTLVAFCHQFESWETPYLENYQTGKDHTRLDNRTVFEELSFFVDELEENDDFEGYNSFNYQLYNVKYYDYGNGKKEEVVGHQQITIFYPKNEQEEKVRTFLDNFNLSSKIKTLYEYNDYIYFVELGSNGNYVLEN